MKKLKRNEFPFPETVNISWESKSLINKILVIDPSKRLSLEQILNHDFLKQNFILGSLSSSTLENPLQGVVWDG